MQSLALRSFQMPSDLARLADLKNAYWRFYQLDQTTTPDKQAFLLSLDHHSAPDDNRVIDHPDHPNRLIAHGWVWLQTPQRVVFDITVDPAWQRKGLGNRLLQWAIERARQLGADIIDHQIAIESAPERQFLQQNSFRPVGTFLNMRLTSPYPAAARVPDGYQFQTYAACNDLALYTHLLNQCYSDLWGHHSGASAEAQAKWLAYYDPTAIFILLAPTGEAVGIVRAQSAQQINTQDGTHTNSVDAPGLVPAYRRPDLYALLVRQGLQWVVGQMPSPQPITMLSWGDLDSTIDCYWRLGFEVIEHAIGYRYYLT